MLLFGKFDVCGEVAERDDFAHQALDFCAVRLVVRGDEEDGGAFLLGAARPPNAVDVLFGVIGDVEVNDVGDGGDVEATGDNVGSDKDAVGAIFEAGYGAEAVVLAFVGVDDAEGLAEFGLEFEVEGVGQFAGSDEDQDFSHGRVVSQELEQQAGFTVEIGDGVAVLLDVFEGGAGGGGFHYFVVVRELVDDLHHVVGHRGGEEEVLTFFGEEIHHIVELAAEAEVQHFVDLVEDKLADVFEAEDAVFEQVAEPAGGADQDVDAGLDFGLVGFDVGAAVDTYYFDGHKLRQPLDFRYDLLDEFAGGDNYQDLGVGRFSEFPEAETGEEVGEGLTRAGLGDADHVAAGHDGGEDFGLDGRWGGDAFFCEGVEEGGVQIEVGEGHGGRRGLVGGGRAADGAKVGRTRLDYFPFTAATASSSMRQPWWRSRLGTTQRAGRWSPKNPA